MWEDHTLIQILSFSHWKNVFFLSLSNTYSVFCHRIPSEKKNKSISVFCRIILWWHHQTSSFSRSSVHRFNNVYHLLLVLHCPVDLVVVTGAQINHDVFVPETHALTTWGSDATPAHRQLCRGCSTWKRTWRCRGRTARTSCWSLALLWCPPGK